MNEVQTAVQTERDPKRKAEDAECVELTPASETCKHSLADQCLALGLLVAGLTLAGALYRKKCRSRRRKRRSKTTAAAGTIDASVGYEVHRGQKEQASRAENFQDT